MSRNSFETFAANLSGSPRRHTLDGREYLISPITIFPPGGGVMNGSKGPLYYPEAVCLANPGAWNDAPLTGRHPTTANGKHVSARNDGVLSKQGIGFLANDRVEGGRRRVDGWFDVEATRNYDRTHGTSILADAEAGRLQEVSTGLVTDDVPAENGASHNGRSYTHVVTGWRPDHLAILPDQRGACAIGDGCGVNNADATAKERGSIWRKLGEFLGVTGNDRHEDGKHVCAKCAPGEMCDACREKAATENAGRYGNPQSTATGLYKRYGSGTGKGEPHEAAQRGAMTLTERDRELGADALREFEETGANPASWVADEATWERAKAAADKGGYDGETYWAVVAHIYKNMGGEVIKTNNEGDFSMILNATQRKTIVTELTANCACWRDGADVLNEMTDERLLAVAKAHKEATENAIVVDAVRETFKPPASLAINEMPAFIKEKIAAKDEEDEEEEDEKKSAAPAANTKTVAKSAEQWLAEAPAEIRTAVANAMAIERREKQLLVDRLTANVADDKSRGRLAAELSKKAIGELRDLSLLVPVRNELPPDYSGLGIGEPTDNAADDDNDILEIPTINWAAEAAASRRRETA